MQTKVQLNLVLEHDGPLTEDHLAFVLRVLKFRLEGSIIASTAGPPVTLSVPDYTV